MKYSKLYTKRGDTGYTDLWKGGRVKKTDIRIITVGNIDELNCSLGQCYFFTKELYDIKEHTAIIQRDLINIMGDIASCSHDDQQSLLDVSKNDDLDNQIKHVAEILDSKKLKQTDWVLYGQGSPEGFILDSIGIKCRKAELQIWKVIDNNFKLQEHVPMYLNKLSKYLYLRARMYDNF